MNNIGFTYVQIGKITGINQNLINNRFIAMKLERVKPPMGTWRNYAKSLKPDTSWHTQYMSEYKAKFSDWSIIWHREQSRRIMNTKYSSMSGDEKKKYNKKATAAKDKSRVIIYARNWKKNKRETDPVWRMMQGMRSRLSVIVKSANVEGVIGMIGCDARQLRAHLESMFTKKMAWDNYGKYWHVDHIIPVSSFDHTDRNQVKQCWHWTNLAPLESIANMEKGDKITQPQMRLLLCSTH